MRTYTLGESFPKPGIFIERGQGLVNGIFRDTVKIRDMKLYLDNNNPPRIEISNVVDGYGTIYECGIMERKDGANTDYALVAGKIGDNRAFVCFDSDLWGITPYFGKKLPKVAVSIHSYIRFASGRSSHVGYTYLLIFYPGNTLIKRSSSNEQYIYCWEGNEFRTWKPEDYFIEVVKPWMASATQQEINQVKASTSSRDHPLLHQFLESGLPRWNEL